MTDTRDDCLFCRLPEIEGERIPLRNEHFYVSMDLFPVNEGHLEVIPFEHIDDFCDMNEEQVRAFFSLMCEAKQYLQDELGIDVSHYNIGVNNGEYAGRTVHHLHVHMIPRHEGDVEDHIGGVRWVVPDRANYKKQTERWGVYAKDQLNFLEVIDSVVDEGIQ